MHVAGLQADPIHRRQVPDGIGGMGVLDQLGFGGRSRREVEEQGSEAIVKASGLNDVSAPPESA